MENSSKYELRNAKKNASESLRPPPFTKCCCFSLRTGSLILGWLQVILCLIFMIIWSMVLHSTRRLQESNLEKELDEAAAPKQDILFALEIVSIIMMVCLSLSMLVAGLLLFGVYKEKPSFVLAFVIIVYIDICLSIIYGLYHYNEGKELVISLFSTMYGFMNVFVAHSYLIELRNKLATKAVEEEE